MEEKLHAIKRLEAGETVKKVAADIGVGTSTVSDWRKSRANIEKWCSTQASTSGIKKSKMMKKAVHDKVNEALYLWFTHCRSKGVPLTGPILQEKALQFNKNLENDPEFKASEGWLEKWKNRYGVRKLQISGEKLSADEGGVIEFKHFLHELIDKEGISGDQLFNCDESGLNFKMLPTSTLASSQEDSAPGYKKKKERVTILACSNVTGTLKLPLCVIGKAVKPRAFKKIKELSTLPVWYRAQKSAWMNSPIFKEWFFKQFVPAVEKYLEANNLPRKAILVLDNAPTHPSTEDLNDRDIKCVFLPPNVTSLCQPMDQGVLESLKRSYRRKLLTVLIAGLDNGKNVTESLKSVNMLDVVMWASQAWNDINPVTLVKSWRKLLDHKASEKWGQNEDEKNKEKEDSEIKNLLKDIPGCDTITNGEVSDWMKSDEQTEFTDGDIIDMVTTDPANPIEDHDEVNNPPISHNEAFKSLEDLINYVEHQEETTPADLMLFRRWRDIVSAKRIRRVQQAKLTSFFEKRE